MTRQRRSPDPGFRQARRRHAPAHVQSFLHAAQVGVHQHGTPAGRTGILLAARLPCGHDGVRHARISAAVEAPDLEQVEHAPPCPRPALSTSAEELWQPSWPAHSAWARQLAPDAACPSRAGVDARGWIALLMAAEPCSASSAARRLQCTCLLQAQQAQHSAAVGAAAGAQLDLGSMK